MKPSNKIIIKKFKEELAAQFKLKDSGALTHILGWNERGEDVITYLPYIKVRMFANYSNDMACKTISFPPHFTFYEGDKLTQTPHLEIVT